ncbi:MAG: glutamine--fructose-6-phosphate transaminase (isomerizing) [Patescibacteria group bacterium]
MCGIFAYTGQKTNTAQNILEGLKTLEYRGYDSWGIAIKPLKTGKLEVEKHIGKIGEAHTDLPSSTFGIGHTRWATHGGVTDENAHPHTNKDKTIAVVHNGIVENHQELRKLLKTKGYQFLSETDSEVLAHLIDYIEHHEKLSFSESVMKCFGMITGSNAIVALNTESEEIVACRNGSPLVLGVGKDETLLASDVTAILPYTRQVHYLLDGEGVVIGKDRSVRLFDLSLGKESPLTLEKIEWSVENAQKGGYPHFMIKEIFEQKKTIFNAIHINSDKISLVSEAIKSADKVFLSGCGTAYHCALLGSYFLARSGVASQAVPANEFDAFAKTVKKNTVFIAISQSGETADTLLAVKAAKQKGAKIVSIINARGSTLERISDFYIPVNTGPEIAVVSTKAFTAQSAILYAIGKSLEAGKNIQKHEQILSQWLNDDLKINIFEIARKLIDSKNIFVIGKHLQFVCALESALKIKEASYIHAEGFASGELKHGVISLIEKGTPTIVLADSETKTDVLSSATEMKSRGAIIIGISPFDAPEFDIHIKTPDMEDFSFIGNVIVGQILGYALSVGRGCDPDKPRNLAKSVTVK